MKKIAMNLRKRITYKAIAFVFLLGIANYSETRASFSENYEKATLAQTHSNNNLVTLNENFASVDYNVFSETDSIASHKLPFKRGVNLTNWLQSSNVRQIQFSKFTKQDFINKESRV